MNIHLRLGFCTAAIIIAAVFAAAPAAAVEISPEAAAQIQREAKAGDAESQAALGSMYANGWGVVKDAREAVRWWRKAAEQGHAEAQYNLGLSYAKGEGVAKDAGEAVRWYRKAAEQGYAEAQYNLGWMYAKGEGVAKDAREAVRWYRQAAEQGVAEAQYNLGNMYSRDEGVAKDAREAVRWWRKAAEQGHAKAQYNLGLMYWNGEGVIENEYEAYIWYSIAKANGNENAAKNLRKRKWHNYLSPAEIKAAKREAAKRLTAIEQRQAVAVAKPDIGGGIAIARPPQAANLAERFFENTWRSVVVIINGDSQGSGVIVRPNIVATNCHVVAGGDVIVYKSNNRKAARDTPFVATVRTSDEDLDFCLLDVAGLWGIPATVRKYATLNIGEDVYGLAAPQGWDLSLSAGLISQLRQAAGRRLIQTDTAISPGSSGGGLFDSDNNLIGIITGKIANEDTEGIGFAIPADLVLGF